MVASIMSKNIAENPSAILLDVKTGAGALLPRLADSISLAQQMVAAGEVPSARPRSSRIRVSRPLSPSPMRLRGTS